MTQVPDELKTKLLSHTEKQEPVVVREFLGWFGAERRGSRVKSQIRSVVEHLGLRAEPDIDSAHIDSRILIQQVTSLNKPSDNPTNSNLVQAAESLAPALQRGAPAFQPRLFDAERVRDEAQEAGCSTRDSDGPGLTSPHQVARLES